MKDRHYSEFLLYLVGYNSDIGNCLNSMKTHSHDFDSFDECLEQLIYDYGLRYGVSLVREMEISANREY